MGVGGGANGVGAEGCWVRACRCASARLDGGYRPEVPWYRTGSRGACRAARGCVESKKVVVNCVGL